MIVATAVFVHPGYSGVLTLELVNIGSVPMLLCPGLRIAQLIVSTLPGATGFAYTDAGPKYVAALRPEASRLGSEAAEVTRLKAIGDRLRGQASEPSSKPDDSKQPSRPQ